MQSCLFIYSFLLLSATALPKLLACSAGGGARRFGWLRRQTIPAGGDG